MRVPRRAGPPPARTMTPGHLRKRSVSLAGHRTSIALEPAFWAALEAAAAARGLSLVALIAELDAARPTLNVPLASALRVYALEARGPVREHRSCQGETRLL